VYENNDISSLVSFCFDLRIYIYIYILFIDQIPLVHISTLTSEQINVMIEYVARVCDEKIV